MLGEGSFFGFELNDAVLLRYTQSDHAASALRCSHLLSSSQFQYPLD